MAMNPTKITAFGIFVAAALAVGVVAPGVAYAQSVDDLNELDVDDNDIVNQTMLQNTEQFLEVKNNAESSGNVAVADNESSASNDATALADVDQSSAQVASNNNSDDDTITQDD